MSVQLNRFHIIAVIVIAGLVSACTSTDPEIAEMKSFKNSRWSLFVIDIQKGYMPFHRQSSVIKNVLRLRDAADNAGVPVIYISNKGGGDFHQAITPREVDIIFEKDSPSAFAGTGLQEYLDANAIETLVLTGISTTHCYAATLYDGMTKGYNIIAAADGHSNNYPNAAELIESFNQRLMDKKKTAVVPSDQIRFPRF